MKQGFKGPTRGLVNNQQAAMITRPEFPRSRFNLRHTVNTTFDAGFLVPFLVDEILPGDHFAYDVSAFLRMSTPLFPIFDSQTVHTFFFFVPNRIVWENWTAFMGELPPGQLTFAGSFPGVVSSATGFLPNTPADYFGLPTQGGAVTSALSVNALPFRAYYAIYNQWFRDQNVINEVVYATDDSPAAETAFVLQKRAKYHDYFTSALPYPFKGNQAGGIPLFGSLPVSGIGFGAGGVTGPTGTLRETGGGSTAYTWYSIETQQPTYFRFSGSTSGFPQIFADLTSSGYMRINDFRQAMAVQGLYERDARGGTRYVELILQHFGVRNPDYRLQRLEYIGGGSSPMLITPVAQTTPVSGGGTVGQLGAAGTGQAMHRANYAATEHGFIIGLINVQTQLSYSQGIEKKWYRSFKTDYYFPALEGIGEQAISRGEIYATGGAADLTTVFGYQERFAEYKTANSRVTGKMRSQASGTLDAWHLGQYFASAPTLSQTFLEDSPPLARVLAAGTAANNQQYYANILVDTQATRPMPMHSTPALLGRF